MPIGVIAAWATLFAPGAGAASPTPAPVASLQRLIDATPATGVLDVPPGIYRESVVIRQPITIHGAGAEIRGSDVWTDWTPRGSSWLSDLTVPKLESKGECRDARCAWPEQVFIDERPLLQVASDPGSGEFAVDAARHVILADDPTTHSVEVTTRAHWMVVEAPNTTIDGFTMREVASPAQAGGLQADAGADHLTVRDVTLSDSHGALISFKDIADGQLLDSSLSRGGQLAVHISGITGLLVAGNSMDDSNTEGFDPAWEAGGLKSTHTDDLTVRDNTVNGNDGPGIWCDIDCSGFVATGNRVGENTRAGIMFEISDGGRIEDNVVWENGWGFATWGWGAGILISSSSHVTVARNTVAWNADGITVVSQDRGRVEVDRVHHVTVEDDTIIGDPGSNGYLLAWLEDWDGGVYDSASDNSASDNRFWHDRPEPAKCRFEWDGCRDRLADFAGTPGGRGSTYLSDTERNTALIAAKLASAPPAVHPVVNDPPRKATVLLVAAIAAAVLGVVALALGVVVVVRRRRRRARARSV